MLLISFTAESENICKQQQDASGFWSAVGVVDRLQLRPSIFSLHGQCRMIPSHAKPQVFAVFDILIIVTTHPDLAVFMLTTTAKADGKTNRFIPCVCAWDKIYSNYILAILCRQTVVT
jgi:hypothetical protein